MSKPVYYKATRPDGTDFRTGRVEYKVGKRVRPLPFNGTPQICGPGYLHASDAPGETLLGGSWPCRLFEVTGKAAAGFNARHVHKGGFRQLTVVREIDAHLALGPNGRHVAAIIERTHRLSYQEAFDLGAAWGAAWDAAGDAALDAAWGAAWRAAWGAARDAALDAARDAVRGAVRGAAGEAALAVLVRDLITSEQFDVLYGPWAKVIDAGAKETR